VAPGYLTAAKPSELPGRMAAALAYVRGLPQGPTPPGLENVAAAVVSPAIATAKSPAVRVAAAECAVELLRVFAPTPPFDASDMTVSAATAKRRAGAARG
jgi:hypothetical protein